MKGYGIEIKNNLLEPKHVAAMGDRSSLWEYMWCLDKMTKIDEDGLGYVLGGKPIKLDELQKDLGKDKSNISANLHKLVIAGYINLKRTGYGNIITVNKAKKNSLRNGDNTKSELAITPDLNGDNAKSELAITPDLNGDNAKSIIDNTVDITIRQRGETPLLSRSTTYLTNIPLEDLTKFSDTYNATKSQIQQIAEEILLYHESTGKKYSNYRATLQSWTLRKYGKRTNGGYVRR